MFALVKTNGNEEIVSCTVSENRNELLQAIKLDASKEITALTAEGYSVESDIRSAYHTAAVHGDGYMYFSYDIVNVISIEQFCK